MAKIMLVEDDNNLREIYQARLAAEGFDIVPAKDGEEALAIAVKEKPDLIVCDVMMPKVSGFEMLDILRSTNGIRDTKVIMMTALSQAEDKARAEKLGADRYLVKSQVTLEDMVKAVQDVLGSTGAAGAPPTTTQDILSSAADSLATPPPKPADQDVLATPPTPATPTIKVDSAASPLDEDDDDDRSDGVTIARKKVIQPLNDLTKKENNLDELLAKEEAKEEIEKQAEVKKPAAVVGNVAPVEEPLHQPPKVETPAAAEVHPPGEVINPQAGASSSDPGSIAI
jgi:CheY-like chemotaxis protein